jgi:hypothetical protein
MTIFRLSSSCFSEIPAFFDGVCSSADLSNSHCLSVSVNARIPREGPILEYRRDSTTGEGAKWRVSHVNELESGIKFIVVKRRQLPGHQQKSIRGAPCSALSTRLVDAYFYTYIFQQTTLRSTYQTNQQDIYEKNGYTRFERDAKHAGNACKQDGTRV